MAKYDRQVVLNIIRSWLGKNERDGSFKVIIDTYNSIKPLPVGYKVSYSDDWCAATYSAAFHAAGYDEICPSECSCNRMINDAKTMGIWVENDAYVPSPGDAVIYDWQDNGVGDNQGFPDHIGMVSKVADGKIYVIEGNANESVVERVIAINDRFIRGFVTPKFDIDSASAPSPAPQPTNSALKVGDVVRVKKAVTYTGKEFKTYVDKYDVLEIKGDRIVIGVGSTIVAAVNASNLEKVGSIATPAPTPQPAPTQQPSPAPVSTYESARAHSDAFNREYKCTDDLNLRYGAGTSKGHVLTMPAGTKVRCYGYYTPAGGVNWLFVTATINGVAYKGFCSAEYLR